jgi:ribosomal protein S6--L-glutamate ligase
MMVHSTASLSSVVDTLRDLGEDVLVQQFLAKGAGHDYRAFVIGNQVVAAMKRTAAKGEFRSNIHRGGEGTLVKLTPQQRRVAVRAAQALNLSIAGVDLMDSASGPMVLEVNSSPGFEGIEKATGLNVAGMMMDVLVESAKRASAKKSTGRSR